MPVTLFVTDDEIAVTAENGTTVRLDRYTGELRPTSVVMTRSAMDESETYLVGTPKPTAASKRIRARLQADGVASAQVTPRWTVRTGDWVMAQHRKGGRKFGTTVKDIVTEDGRKFVKVCDPRNGGTYVLALDRITKGHR